MYLMHLASETTERADALQPNTKTAPKATFLKATALGHGQDVPDEAIQRVLFSRERAVDLPDGPRASAQRAPLRRPASPLRLRLRHVCAEKRRVRSLFLLQKLLKTLLSNMNQIRLITGGRVNNNSCITQNKSICDTWYMLLISIALKEHAARVHSVTQCLLTCNSESGLAPMKFKSRSEERQKTQKLAVMMRLRVLLLLCWFLRAPRHVSSSRAQSPGARFISALISSRAAKETKRAVNYNGKGGELGQIVFILNPPPVREKKQFILPNVRGATLESLLH